MIVILFSNAYDNDNFKKVSIIVLFLLFYILLLFTN